MLFFCCLKQSVVPMITQKEVSITNYWLHWALDSVINEIIFNEKLFSQNKRLASIIKRKQDSNENSTVLS